MGYCSKGLVGDPSRCKRLTIESDRTIIITYLRLCRGLLSYYRMATNFTKLKNRLFYIMYYSCVLTLASKHKFGTKRKTIKFYGPKLTQWKSGPNGEDVVDVLFDKDSMLGGITKVKEHKDYVLNQKKVSNQKNANIDPFLWIEQASFMVPRSKKKVDAKCSKCGSDVAVEMHHVRKLKDIKSKDYLTGRKIKMNRKQIPLCKLCHTNLHKNA